MQYDSTTFNLCHSHWLPLRAAEDPNSTFGFAFSFDPDAVVFQLSLGLLAPVTFIGTLPDSAESKVVPSNKLDEYLMENFSYLLVYLDGAHHNEFYDDFCKDYLWTLFVDRVIEVVSPNNGDLVIVHNYHLGCSLKI
ncbi:alpha,alpha-trehalose-phosphate synthase [UDP-forming] 5-like [Miscanthus floridulus]|uniref:alpha,alpha-trehalose-phosphate synthase [UDP-forming] 5-like n=1 Tax=Miscanthus floridulus TaxID=154761 RepID=UPI0034594FEC